MPLELLWEAAALLAKWFHFQPSEIDGMEAGDFMAWVRQANRQIAAMDAD